MHGKQINEAVTKVTWMPAARSSPGKFQQFPLSVGQLPEDTDQLVFKAIQTYDNKEVVRWIEEPKEGAAEPENPAPVLEADRRHGDGRPPRRRRDRRTADERPTRRPRSTATPSAADERPATPPPGSSASSASSSALAGVAFGVLAGRRRRTA